MTAEGSALPTSLPERMARHERWIVVAGLVLVSAAGLYATLRTGDVLMVQDRPGAGSATYIALLFVMWWTMMMAMMLPSAAPAILIYGAVSRRFSAKVSAPAHVLLFAAGYGAVWTAFSAVAVALQLLVRPSIALSGMMAVASASIGALLLLAAGVYQLTPLKYACLQKCQSPLMHFAQNWRQGAGGALRMGLAHGTYCLGCCWVLMGLLFYGGVMELRWIVGIAAYVAIEKLVPMQTRIVRFTGLLLILWGLSELYHALF